MNKALAALWVVVGALVVAAVVVHQRVTEQLREQDERLERNRAALAEVARQIEALPDEATLQRELDETLKKLQAIEALKQPPPTLGVPTTGAAP